MNQSKSGTATVVPGHADQSELIARIHSADPDERMPPPESNRILTESQKKLLKQWIDEGAHYEAHWALLSPVCPPLPDVRKSEWSRNEIDRFILAKLEQNGLEPSAEADRNTLIRRLTLDLTGLPPNPQDVEAFVADRSPDAYERIVDRLLHSDEFGEHMAKTWLDAARYADTNGYQNDGERSMWRWRDWVIHAYNQNMPFDQFTVEQLAGDLLPNATESQRIATAFNRNHRGNAEGGIVPEEYAVEYVADRVETTSTVWLGMTIGCARCHDHKYDPVTQREFYQLFAFFNNVPENGRAVKFGNSPPFMTAPTRTQQAELSQLDQELRSAEMGLIDLEPMTARMQSEWERALRDDPNGYDPKRRWSVSRSLIFSLPLDAPSALSTARFEGGEGRSVPGRNGPVTSLEGGCFIDAGDVGNFGFLDKFTIAVWVQPNGKRGTIFSRMVEQLEDSAFASDSEGYRVYWNDGRIQVHLTKRWLDDALRVETTSDFPSDRLHHVAVVYDGSRVASGVRIYVDGQLQPVRVLLDQLNQSFQTKQPFRIGAGGGPSDRLSCLVSDVRIYESVLSEEEIAIVATNSNIEVLAAIPVSQRTRAQSAKLRACFVSEHATSAIRNAYSNAQELRKKRARLIETMPTLMVMEEMQPPRASHVLRRGEYDKPMEQVAADVPACFPPMPKNENNDRLGFAKWLVSPNHPLTARVAINHQWQAIFGTGVVKTTEDFGMQGDIPSHPELLDWLACEFVRMGWDIKAMLKTIVTSATYRQSSQVSMEMLERDPDNRLLARSPRTRLPAEVIRDQALAVSGLLVRRIGGPSVRPYQPKGLWKELSGTDYDQDHGEKLWLRSLYTFWKRTSPQPTMMTFDSSGRETCRVRSSRTNTPLQALALMNDLTFVESSRFLAQRVLRECSTESQDPDIERLNLAFRLVLARSPTSGELTLLMNNLNFNLANFRREPSKIGLLLRHGEAANDLTADTEELAAYTAVCSLLLNLDETIMRP